MPQHETSASGNEKWAEPADLGLSPQGLTRAYEILEAYVAAERVPGLVALVGTGGKMLAPYAVGWAALQPLRIPMNPRTLFDLASITKAVATTTAVLQLLEAGHWRLDDPVSLFWPEFPGQVTLRHLLTHTSGLPAWQPVYAQGAGRERYRRFLEQVPLESEPGSKVVYSCLGFLILGALVEEVTELPFDQYCAEQIFKPLGMEETCFNPPQELWHRCAATELRPGSTAPLQGVVHDENARQRGGVAGNSGLFATAYELGRFCQAMLQGGTLEGEQVLSKSTVQLATRDLTSHLGTSRGLGWVVKGAGTHSSAGDLLSPRSFGHTGFTGTSLWIDPEAGLFLLLLTNRVHPTRENSHHIRLRALFHNAVAAAL